MFHTVVVGDDGSDRSDAAIALACRLLAPGGCLVLVSVVAGATARRRAMKRLEAHAAALAGEAPVEIEVLEGCPPAAGLVAVTKARGADLLVLAPPVGGPGVRRSARSTVQRILHSASCTVAVASAGRPGRTNGAGLRLVVAFDGSPESEAAVELAYAVAADLGGTVRLCRVLESADRSDPGVVDQLEAAAGRAPAGVEAEFVIVVGDAVRSLQEESLDGDLLVLGSRRRGRVMRAVAGSVSAALVAEAALPLIVAPRVVSGDALRSSPHDDPVDLPMPASPPSGTLRT